MTTVSNEVALRIDGVNKRFGATHANKNISLELWRGEIHGLAGENGSGKSTLVSILAGIYKKDSGVIIKDNEVYEPQNPSDAINNKIGIVVQELGMVDTLPIGINIFLGRLDGFKKAGIVRINEIFNAGAKLLEQWGLGEELPLRDLAGNHTIETRKLAEIARALSIDPDILIIDEATQSLSHDKRKVLYSILQECKKKGKTIIVITHDLEEMVRITDRITVLRDGEIVGTVISKTTEPDEVKRMLVGREITGEYYRTDAEESFEPEVALEVKNLSGVDLSVNDVSFDLHKGEILAICGLSDAGMHNLGKVILGLEKRTSGSVILKETGQRIHSPAEAMESGFCYVPKDRDGEAMLLQASVMDNFCIPSAVNLSTVLGFLNPKRLKDYALDGIRKFNVITTGPNQIASVLSGGNKQKINLGRWLLRDTKIFILDCPTRGVDVGVKAYIYDLMREIKRDGYAILLISDEISEAMGMADRILVMKNGKVEAILSRGEGFTEEKIIEVML